MTRVSPAIEADFSLTAARVVVVLDRLKQDWGLPEAISVDNGPEFISRALDDWAHRNGVALEFSRPGRPTDNPFIESFNGHFREECLDQHWFADLAEARQVIEGSVDERATIVRYARALGRKDRKPPFSTRLFCRQV